MAIAQILQLIAIANKLADVVRIRGDDELTEIFDQLIIYISKLES